MNPFCTVEVGDFIRAYHKGIHKVTKVERRFHTKYDEEHYGNEEDKKNGKFKAGTEYSSLVTYQCIIDGNMNIKKKPGKEQCCDAAFCKLVSPKDLFNEGMDIKNKYDVAGRFIYDELSKK